MKNNNFLDNPIDVRETKAIDSGRLSDFLKDKLDGFTTINEIKQFPSGFSNLTFSLDTNLGEFVLRRPPFGANIKSAHDMSREFRVLKMLHPTFGKVPAPILYSDDESVMGSEFYMMERMRGTILRNKAPEGLKISGDWMRRLSGACIKELANLHNLDTKTPEFKDFGKPDGYVGRQVEGWIRRYHRSMTDSIPGVESVEEWMKGNIPAEEFHAFIHNDFKYDNVVIDAEDPTTIKAILDWEMATIGDALMDLGTSLGYWAEESDIEAIKAFSLTSYPGNYNREEIAQLYFSHSNLDEKNVVFYYVFGSYKIAVIGQQIYARFKKGLTNDKRFGMLIYLVKACMANAQKAIQLNRISNLY